MLHGFWRRGMALTERSPTVFALVSPGRASPYKPTRGRGPGSPPLAREFGRGAWTLGRPSEPGCCPSLERSRRSDSRSQLGRPRPPFAHAAPAEGKSPGPGCSLCGRPAPRGHPFGTMPRGGLFFGASRQAANLPRPTGFPANGRDGCLPRNPPTFGLKVLWTCSAIMGLLHPPPSWSGACAPAGVPRSVCSLRRGSAAVQILEGELMDLPEGLSGPPARDLPQAVHHWRAPLCRRPSAKPSLRARETSERDGGKPKSRVPARSLCGPPPGLATRWSLAAAVTGLQSGTGPPSNPFPLRASSPRPNQPVRGAQRKGRTGQIRKSARPLFEGDAELAGGPSCG